MSTSNDNPRYQQQRLEAIRAAASVFASKGFHGASTKDIADRLGIKQGSLYYYFSSKQEALSEVCLYGIRDYVSRMDRIVEGHQGFEAKLFAVVTSHLSSYREKNEALKVHNDERLYLPEEKRTDLKKLGSHYREQLEKIIDQGKQAGDMEKSLDTHFVAQAVIGLCNSFGDLIVRDQELDVIDLTQKCTELLLSGLRKRQLSENKL